jgi:hypothetical protein
MPAKVSIPTSGASQACAIPTDYSSPSSSRSVVVMIAKKAMKRSRGVPERGDLAGDRPEMPAAPTCEVEDRLDRQREHRSLHELATLRAKHRPRLRMLLKQTLIDERCKIRAVRGCELKALFDRIGKSIHPRFRPADKKRTGPWPRSKIVSTLLSPILRFALD